MENYIGCVFVYWYQVYDRKSSRCRLDIMQLFAHMYQMMFLMHSFALYIPITTL